MSERRRTRQRWTHDELATLTAHYAKMGPSWEGWAELLPRRNKVSIEHAAKRAGLRVRDRASPKGHMPDDRDIPAPLGSWTTAEIDALDREYVAHSYRWSGWEQLLPGRLPAQIRSMATLRGLHMDSTPEMDARLDRALSIICEQTSSSAMAVLARMVELRRGRC